MDARDNIIKIAHFEATSAKNAADFESVGELMVYYGKKGWHPKWHTEAKDSIDFMMENIQNYLKRLVVNEGNFAEQVEDKRERYNMTERLEEIENEKVEFDETADIQYEGEDECRGQSSISRIAGRVGFGYPMDRFSRLRDDGGGRSANQRAEGAWRGERRAGVGNLGRRQGAREGAEPFLRNPFRTLGADGGHLLAFRYGGCLCGKCRRKRR